MRTEVQKKMDKKGGLENIEFHFDNETGEVVETGIVSKRINCEILENSLASYREEVNKASLEIEEIQNQLEKLKDFEEDEEVLNFIMLLNKANKLNQKKNLEGQLKARLDEIEFNKDNLQDQQRFVEQYREWKKKFRQPVKKSGGIE